MDKKKRKGSDKHKKDPGKKQKASRSSQGKQRQERRDGWTTRRRQVIKVPKGAVLRGCKKTRRKLREHLRLRAEIHSQLRVIASFALGRAGGVHGAVLLARLCRELCQQGAGSSASQGQGVPWPGVQASARQSTQGPGAAAACCGTGMCAPYLELSSAYT
ncbi:hypothetical protein HaLaN_08132 [Haematococcus lacustris]|uniref:Uncharacterized protein n=1 Tax=Haematococcus lacustris TaxID=44745 RepID=A0A699Z0J0_HAELA|nr:hypothetical protein HaLaN_08132 [Haematococcus lacustris]